MNTEQIRINTHSSIRIEGSRTVYFDPFQIKEDPHDADVVCITHEHFDHFDPESIEKIRKADTVFICPAGMKKKLESMADEEHCRLIQPGGEIVMGDMIVTGMPAYNKLKPFHPKHNKWLGYLLEMDGIRYYIAGDTDALSELQGIRCSIALVPVGGTYTMTAKEAAALVNKMRPDTAIPTHYGSIVGSMEDADTFRKLVDPAVEVITKI